MKSDKSIFPSSTPAGRYATAEEANRAKNADLIAKLKKMNLQIINGQPVVKQNDQG